MRLFAFFDESGEFTYHPDRGAFIVFVGVVTPDPMLFTSEFAALRYELLQQGCRLERFHAASDKQVVRDRVFDLLAASRGYAVHSIVLRKNRVNPKLYKYGPYSIAYRTMLKYLVGSGNRIRNIHIIADTAPGKKQQTNLEQFLRLRAEEVLRPRGIEYSVDHHNSSAHALLQAADYCAWAIQKKWKDGELRPYGRIQSRIENEFDIYGRGNTDYY